jgi:CRP-like cAMP-binding protein
MLDTLPCIPLFHDLEIEQVLRLKPLFERVVYPHDTNIIRQGEIASYIYLIVNGNAAIHYKPYDGPSLLLTRLHTGDVCGWSALVGSHFYTSSIISESRVEALRIRGCHFLSLIREHPETGRVILDRLARSVSPRWENAHEQVEALLNSNQ